jgi:hypothetical protein
MSMTVAGRGRCRFGFQKGRRLGHEAVATAHATEVKGLACMLRRGSGAILRDSHATDWINNSHTHLPD